MNRMSVGRRALVFLIGMVFVGAGLYMVSSGQSDIAGGLRSNSWAPTQGTIEASRVHTVSGPRGGTAFLPTASFHYRVNEADHRSRRIRFGGATGSSSAWVAEDWVARHPAGSTVTIYYDPRDPSEAVIERGLKISALLMPVMGLLFLGLGLIPIGVAIAGPFRDRARPAAGADSRPRLEVVSVDGRRIVLRRRPHRLGGLAAAAFGIFLGLIALLIGLGSWPAIQWVPMALLLAISGVVLWIAYSISAVRETAIDAPTRSATITRSLCGWSRATRYPLDGYGVVRCETLITNHRDREPDVEHLVELRTPDVATAPGRLLGPGAFHLLTADTPEQARELAGLISELLGLEQLDAGARVDGPALSG